MRLSCPNCDAQYEVPDEVMPTSGRDVQCSNCGQTWFQHHPDHLPEEEAEARAVNEPDADEEVSPPPPPAVPTTPPPARKQLDPSVADILRQEAEAERAARDREARGGVESQPELGLDEGDTGADPGPQGQDDIDAAARQRALEARRRMARMRGEEDPSLSRDASSGSRRALLPDIDEINSTLRSDKDRARTEAKARGIGEEPRPKRERRGFRGGFAAALLIFAIMALLYVYAPDIAQAAPQVDPYLSAYVGWVDQMRLLLDRQVDSAVTWLEGIASQGQ